ncbi:hypothetical protein EBY67_01065 [bacterium]|nr:hypothetical protein [bacterium]
MHEDGDEIKYFGQGRQAEVGWDWHSWRQEVERRVVACEAAIRLAMEPEDALATLVDALRPPDSVAPDPLVEVVPSPVAGAVTVDLTPVTGGVFGVAPAAPATVHTTRAGATEVAVVAANEAAAAAAAAVAAMAPAAAAMSTPTKSARKRAVRVTPTEARVRVQQALTSAQSTIRGITAWETATGWGNPLTSSQIRPALTELEKRGDVHVVGKRGKQEIWAIKS